MLSLRIIFIDKLFFLSLFAYFSPTLTFFFSLLPLLLPAEKKWTSLSPEYVPQYTYNRKSLPSTTSRCLLFCCSTPCYAISRQRWHNGSEIKSSANHFSSETSEVVSQLFIENVTREYYGSKFECRAQNSKVLSPVVKEILVQIHCKLLVFFFHEPSSSSLRVANMHTQSGEKSFFALSWVWVW